MYLRCVLDRLVAFCTTLVGKEIMLLTVEQRLCERCCFAAWSDVQSACSVVL